jgi:hypothetical protein
MIIRSPAVCTGPGSERRRKAVKTESYLYHETGYSPLFLLRYKIYF